MFIFQCLPLFLFSLFSASPFFTFSFFVSRLFFSFFLPSCFACQFLVLAFVFVLIAFCFKMFFCFCVSACCLVCFESQYYIFFLCIQFCCCCCFCFCCFGVLLFFEFWLPIKNISQKLEIPKTPKMKNEEETDILTKTVSTGVFTNSVFFVFLSV